MSVRLRRKNKQKTKHKKAKPKKNKPKQNPIAQEKNNFPGGKNNRK